VTQAKTNALLELIERHIILSAWMLNVTPHSISHDSVTPDLVELLNYIDSTGYKVHILEIESVLNIPVILLMAEAQKEGIPYLLSSSAAAMSKWHSVQKALYDLIKAIHWHQKYTNLINVGQNDDIDANTINHAKLYYNRNKKDRWQFLIDRPPVKIPLVNDMYFPHEACTNQLTNLLKMLQPRGDIYFVDRTPKALNRLGVHIVTALAEGLQPIHFGPGLFRFRNHKIMSSDFSQSVRVGREVTDLGFNQFPHIFS
jgi:ribosomal protein S12 methylthiotransferase accessory factor YcaO